MTRLDRVKQGLADFKREFTRHPEEMNQSYGRHLVESLISCGCHVGQAFQFLFHGCFPFCFPHIDVEMQDTLTKDQDVNFEEDDSSEDLNE